jgi:UDP-N-acetylmuramoyl-tripeptide--D-alanyl-D-alanine ligase
LGLNKRAGMPMALFRLVAFMRRIRPEIVMTWRYHAHLITTLAAILSGIGTDGVVWILRYSNPHGAARWTLMLSAWLSPLPWGVVSSHDGHPEHLALGYRARRWFDVSQYKKLRIKAAGSHSTTTSISSQTENVWCSCGKIQSVGSYRQLWRLIRATKKRKTELAFFSRRRNDFKKRLRRLRSAVRARFGRALQSWKYWLAQVHRIWLWNTTFIAVTGSCGKSTTTNLVGAILSTRGHCYQKRGDNFIQHSVATLLSLASSTKYCIQEVSAYPLGQIEKHVRVLRPRIAVVVAIGDDHYKSFRGVEAAAKEKGKLIQKLSKRSTAILNADEPHIRSMADRTRAKILTFGLSPNADVRATEISSVWPDRLRLTVVHAEEKVVVQTRMVGEHWTPSVLSAVACGIATGVDLKSCAEAIERCEPIYGRYSVHKSDNSSIFILDSWKAPLWTIASGLSFVRAARASRKTIVFGTISDYPGAGSPKYRSIARKALEVADRVIFVGPNSGHVSKLSQGPLSERLFTFTTSYQASAFLRQTGRANELIYVKASRVDHLDRLMLAQTDQVVCWRERCGVLLPCKSCARFRKPHPPPFGLAKIELTVAHPNEILAN